MRERFSTVGRVARTPDYRFYRMLQPGGAAQRGARFYFCARFRRFHWLRYNAGIHTQARVPCMEIRDSTVLHNIILHVMMYRH